MRFNVNRKQEVRGRYYTSSLRAGKRYKNRTNALKLIYKADILVSFYFLYIHIYIS